MAKTVRKSGGAPRATFQQLVDKPKPVKTVTVYTDEDAPERLAKAIGDVDQLEQLIKTVRQRAEAGRVGKDSDFGDDAGYDRAIKRVKELEERLEEAKTRLDDAEAFAAEHSVEVLFRSIGRKAYDALIKLHPPTDEQDAEFREVTKQAAPYNPDTFSVALIAKSCVAPVMTEAEVQQLFDEWNGNEAVELFTAALEVNQTRRVGDLGKRRG